MSRGGQILTINGGSSSIKFALFEQDAPKPRRIVSGEVEGIGLGETVLKTREGNGTVQKQAVTAGSHTEGGEALAGWLGKRVGKTELFGIGHRVVHGGLQLTEHHRVTAEVMGELKKARPLDLAHLPREIGLIETFEKHFPDVPQVVCLDTAFHRDLPRVAQLLPIPHRFFDAGVRRLGFHGLSYTYLMGELARIAGDKAARGRVVMAHLGSGASMVALKAGKPVDTTMAFTPTAGLMMGSRPGDIDPGLLLYVMRSEKLSTEKMDEFISKQCGLIGVSGSTFDMRKLIAQRPTDARAADAVNLFCQQAKKWLGAYAAALGGVDTLVFSGGIGEHGAEVRAGICAGLEFLGVQIDFASNEASAQVISRPGGGVTVRVIPTDEEIVIAETVLRLIS